MKRSDILTPIGMLLGIGLIVFAISQGNLFFMTGLAIVLYLNQTPGQPRERDYAYAGSFYAFAIWIGIGAAGLCDMLRRKTTSTVQVSVLMTICLLIPVQMASQTWDDHDRSARFKMCIRDRYILRGLSVIPNVSVRLSGST